MDPALDDTLSSCKLIKCLQIALLCVQENPIDRPSMLEVSSMLKNETAIVTIPKRPAFSVKTDEDDKNRPEQLHLKICSVDDATISQVVGRWGSTFLQKLEANAKSVYRLEQQARCVFSRLLSEIYGKSLTACTLLMESNNSEACLCKNWFRMCNLTIMPCNMPLSTKQLVLNKFAHWLHVLGQLAIRKVILSK